MWCVGAENEKHLWDVLGLPPLVENHYKEQSDHCFQQPYRKVIPNDKERQRNVNLFFLWKRKIKLWGPTSMGSPVSFFSKVPVFSIPYNPWPAYSNLTANYSLLSKKFQLGCAFFIYFWSFQRTAHIPSL